MPSTPPTPHIKAVLDQLPLYAELVLIDPKTEDWKRGSFLINESGELTRGFQGVQPLIMNRPAKEALADLLSRTDNDPLYNLKGHLMHRVIKAAKAEQIIEGNVQQITSYISLMPPRAAGRSC